MTRKQARPTPVLAFLATGLLAGPAAAPFDLDVGIPPGSPTEWGQRFPAITPRPAPVFTGSGDRDPRADDPTRTVAGGTAEKLDVQVASTFGIVRILTWDVTGHLRWVSATTGSRVPITGIGSNAPLPEPSTALNWTVAAALLRILLHPQLVSEKELTAHLVEIGEPAAGMLAAARAEPALAGVCKEVGARIAAGKRAARPLPGANPRASMMSRFVHDELIATFPHDPEGGFGRRMFLFAEEVEPVLAEYADHEDPLLRRNAVAALARYRTAAASRTLLQAATKPDDPVVQMRALAAMDGSRPLRAPDALLQRLELSNDPVEQVALIQALGRVGLLEAAPALVQIGSRANVDSDLLMAVLSALIRIRHGMDSDEVTRFADRIAKLAKSDPIRFRVHGGESAPAADVPDSPRTRGQVLAQLALLLQVRLRPGDAELVERVMELLPEDPEPGPGRVRGAFTNASLAGVHPPVQMLLLETLRELGPPGYERLGSVAGDRSVEPVLRGRALSLLPTVDRGPLAVGILESRRESDEMKIYAVELLGLDGHEKLRDLAAPILAECAEPREKEASPELRYLWLALVRALERRGLLEADDILPCLARISAAGKARTDVTEELRELVARLVVDTAAGLSRAKLRDRIDEVLSLVVEHRLNPTITAETQLEAREYVGKQLLGLKGHRADLTYHRLVTEAVLRYLLASQMRLPNVNRAEFSPVVLLEDEILLALGRSGSSTAAAALARFLREQEDSPFRAAACLALGASGHPDLARHLVPYLLDADGFVRFCAYEGLRHLTGQDFPADWMYGAPGERGTAAEKYLRWCLRNR